MQLTLDSIPLTFADSHGGAFIGLRRFGLHVESCPKVAGEARFWIERETGAWRGRIGPLLFVADIPTPTKSKRSPCGPQSENED